MSEPTGSERIPPARRVRVSVVAYLVGHLGGYYDMRTHIEGGETFSIPEHCVDDDKVCGLGPEQLTADDWGDIEAQVYARIGSKRAAPLIAQWRKAAEGVQS